MPVSEFPRAKLPTRIDKSSAGWVTPPGPIDLSSPSESDLAATPASALQAGATLGEALRAAREGLGLSIEDVAETTRVRRAYLACIEEMQFDALPSRPFTTGYIRAYAAALDLDPAEALERFKAEEPVLDEPLKAPVGVLEQRDPRVVIFVAAAIVIVVAIVFWNVAQRASSDSAPPPPRAPEETGWKFLAEIEPGLVSLGAPLPAPVESTTPPLYETPGLAQAGPDGMGNNAPPLANIHAADEQTVAQLAALPPTFIPKGAIYGAKNIEIASTVTLQALKAAALIVRGGDGSVYFARQLAAGEAYRVPRIAGLTIDVSEPRDLQVFVDGRSTGLLPAAEVLASKLAG